MCVDNLEKERNMVAKEEEEVPIQYTVSPLLQYTMKEEEEQQDEEVDMKAPKIIRRSSSGKNNNEPVVGSDYDDDDTARVDSSSSSGDADKTTTKTISTLSPVGPRLCPPKGLGAIYSLDFWANNNNTMKGNRNKCNWLVGAGKSGIIALWDTTHIKQNNKIIDDDDDGEDEDGMIHPIFSWTGHSGRWISGAKFLSNSTTTTPSRLVTSSNDGTVCLWDLTKVTTTSNVPKVLYQTSKDLHRSGVFAMDILQRGESDSNASVHICTGSKDKTIAIHSVEDYMMTSSSSSSSSSNNNNRGVLWRSDYHAGKVGAVQFQGAGSSLVASASDDGYVAIHDYRGPATSSSSSSSSGGLVAEIGNAHTRPHSVVWDKFEGSGDNQYFLTGKEAK